MTEKNQRPDDGRFNPFKKRRVLISTILGIVVVVAILLLPLFL